jgi:ActR/RegA family two-component response regulator
MGDVVAGAAGVTTTVEGRGVTVPMKAGAAAAAVTVVVAVAVAAAVSVSVAAAAGLDWLFNTVRKSAAEEEVPVLTGVSDLRCWAGGVYVGRVAVLNVGST